MEILVALGLGWVIGIMQGGVHIHNKGDEIPEEENSSVMVEDENVQLHYKQNKNPNVW